MKNVVITTDGSCQPNPGPGAWACLLRFGNTHKSLSGGELETTNNRMEITAAIRGLESLTEVCKVKIVTDSQYLANGITKWVAAWRRKNWKSKDGDPIKNKDLWLQLDALCKRHTVEWEWVRGHNGHPDNERVDALAEATRHYILREKDETRKIA